MSLDPGIWYQGAVRFPFTGKEWPFRTEKWAEESERIREYYNLVDYGGNN